MRQTAKAGSRSHRARGSRLAACCFCFCFGFGFAPELDRDRYRSRGQNTAPQPRPSRLPSRPVRPACPRDAKRKAPVTGPGRPSSNPDGTAVRRRDANRANRAARALKTA
ncbi:hypothetical protein CF650_17080 [Burkholderia sp. 129]|nr:hypothetical protein CF650_17080 [Burkholderia sp. 129]